MFKTISENIKKIENEFDNYISELGFDSSVNFITLDIYKEIGKTYKAIITLELSEKGLEFKFIISLRDLINNSLDWKTEFIYKDLVRMINGEKCIILNEYKEVKLINEIMTVSEASEIWGLAEGTIRAAIKNNRFTENYDYRKSGRITLITKEAMLRVYGESKSK